MKNFGKLFGNLNRAHSAKVPLLIIALVAVIGLLTAACDNGSREEEGPLQDTWSGIDTQGGETPVIMKLTFSGWNWTIQIKGDGPFINLLKGTYSEEPNSYFTFTAREGLRGNSWEKIDPPIPYTVELVNSKLFFPLYEDEPVILFKD